MPFASALRSWTVLRAG